MKMDAMGGACGIHGGEEKWRGNILMLVNVASKLIDWLSIILFIKLYLTVANCRKRCGNENNLTYTYINT